MKREFTRLEVSDSKRDNHDKKSIHTTAIDLFNSLYKGSLKNKTKGLKLHRETIPTAPS